MKQSVEVEIAGQRLVIRSDEGPGYVHELAHYVDGLLGKQRPGTSPLQLQRVALLVAMQIADDLFREKDLHLRYRQKIEAKLAELDQALREHEARIAALAEPEPPAESTPPRGSKPSDGPDADR